MKIRFSFVALAALLLLAIGVPAALAQGPSNLPFRPLHADSYARLKAAADAEAESAFQGNPATVDARTLAAPSVSVNVEGLRNTGLTPSDSTGAAGPTEYIEFINTNVGVYDRAGTLLSQNTMSGLGGIGSHGASDPQMKWDPSQDRFFYVFIDTTNYQLVWGFSKGSAPSAAATDWCSYTSGLGVYGGNVLPDYPKLGDSTDFLLVGVNRFNGNSYGGSDVAWMGKPTAGVITTCPALNTFKTGVQAHLKNLDNSDASTPEPAWQTDISSTGYVMADQDTSIVPTGTYLSLYNVTKDPGTGSAVFSAARQISVTGYSLPPSASEGGSRKKLDTLDGRLFQTVAAIDPAHASQAIWTEHTVKASAGGIGSEVRWYEIDAVNAAIYQSGIIHSSSLAVFNGAVSPDRLVNGTTANFGSNMVASFNTSGRNADAAIQVISKIGANPPSGFVLVKQSPGPNVDFSCTNTCRWGDYAGASPDPGASPTGSSGAVWFAGMWNHQSGNSSDVDWATEVYSVNP